VVSEQFDMGTTMIIVMLMTKKDDEASKIVHLTMTVTMTRRVRNRNYCCCATVIGMNDAPRKEIVVR